MKWNAQLYDSKHAFVGAYGKDLLALVNREQGQAILDLGCGTGALSGELAAKGAEVTGADFSQEMLQAAKKRWPQLHFLQGDAAALPFREMFDTVFSNAVFHWIQDQEALLKNIWNMLRPGGVLVFEMGAKGCGKKVEDAFARQSAGVGYAFQPSFFFPDSQTYEELLAQAGFEKIELWEFDRPTPLRDGRSGLRQWVRQFYSAHLEAMGECAAESVLRGLEKELYSVLWEEDAWVIDYRRLRGRCRKPMANADE